MRPSPIRAFQWDLARQVERLDWLVRQLPRYADWGYEELYLHLEDAVEYPSLPGVARRDAYSYREMERLVAAARKVGIGVVPIANLLGHTQYLIKVPQWRDLNERRGPDGQALPEGQICPLHPRTEDLARKLIADVAPLCTVGKLHVGLDESYALGRHPLSQAEIKEVGLGGHFGRYVRRLHGWVAERGLRMGYWADMLALLPDAIAWLPAGTAAYDWYYYPFRRRPALEPLGFRGYDLSGKLRARGVEYWGCPMSGPFRHEPMPTFGDRLANLRDWWRRCRQVGAAGYLVTSWEMARTGAELVQAVDAAAASLWLEGDRAGRSGDSEGAAGELSDEGMLVAGLRRTFGRAAGRGSAKNGGLGLGEARTLARRLLQADRYAYAGYARWEVEGSWSVAAGRCEPKEAEKEVGVFRAGGTPAAARPAGPAAIRARRAGVRRGWPRAVRAAWEFRSYLAERDAFLARAADGVWRLRRCLAGGKKADGGWAREVSELDADARHMRHALRPGRAAARALWLRTRRRVACCPNEAVIAADAARLGEWRAWLRRVRNDPALVWGSSPVGGAWQFICRVHAVQPALQCVVLQRRNAEGAWQDVRARPTIEFTAAGARRRGSVVRTFTAPLDAAPRRLRLALRGVGRVAISEPELTDGKTSRQPKGWQPGARRMLAHAPPPTGIPDAGGSVNAATLELDFGSNDGLHPASDLRQSIRLLR